MNTPVTPGAQSDPADQDEKDRGVKTAYLLGALTSQGDIDRAKNIYGSALESAAYKTEETGWDGLTKGQEAQQEHVDAERKLYEELEEERARNNEIIAQLEEQDRELCKQIDKMDAGAIMMPDGRRAYKDKDGNFVYLDGTKVDDQDYARKQDAANGGHTQGYEARAQAEALHNKNQAEIDAAQARIRKIDSAEQGTAGLDARQQAAAKITEETSLAVVAKDVTINATNRDDVTTSAVAAATTDSSDDSIFSMTNRHTSHGQPQNQSTAQNNLIAMPDGKTVYKDAQGNFVYSDGTSLASTDAVHASQAEAASQAAVAQASRTSYASGLDPSQLSSKGAFTVATTAAAVPASTIPDIAQENVGSSQRNPVTPSPTAAV